MKRKKVGSPCFLCEKYLRECDGNRPCSKCVTDGRPQMCIGTELSLVKSDGQKLNTEVKEIPSKEISSTMLNVPTSTQITPRQVYLSSTSNPNHENKQKNEAATGKEKISQAVTVSDSSSPHLQVNPWIMDELKALREEQKRLNEEILALKLQNLTLSNKLDSTLSQHPFMLGGGLDPNKAMVVFDLTKVPAVVLTANEMFCKMLSYEMREVLGSPWYKFIHPDYIQRTMQILTQQNLKDSVVSFEQVYQDKNGSIFSTIDTHTIFFTNGKPMSDFVCIAPYSNKIASTTNQLRAFSFPALTDSMTMGADQANPRLPPVAQPQQQGSTPDLSTPIYSPSEVSQVSVLPSSPTSPISPEKPCNTPSQQTNLLLEPPSSSVPQPQSSDSTQDLLFDDLDHLDLDSFLNTMSS